MTLLARPGYGVDGKPLTAAAPLVVFGTLSGLVDYGSTGSVSVTLDASINRQSSATVKFAQASSAATYTIARYLGVNLNLLNVRDMYLRIYNPSGTVSTNNLQFYVASGAVGDFTFNSTVTLGATVTGSAKHGWNDLHFRVSDLTGNADLSAITTIMFKFNTFSAADTVYLDSLWAGQYARPMVLIQFDDSVIDQTAAYVVANSYGVPVTSYAIKNYIEDNATYPGYQSKADILAMYAAGNDISIHHENPYTNLNYSDATKELIVNKNWLGSLGFTRSSAHMSWPEGKFSDVSISAAKSAGIRTARTLQGIASGASWLDSVANNAREVTALGVSDFHKINSVGTAGLTLAALTTHVDNAIIYGDSLFFYIHTIRAGGNVTVSDFDALCAYVRRKVLSGLIDAVTISQWYAVVTGERRFAG